MDRFVSNILSNNVLEAKNILISRLKEIIEEKIEVVRLRVSAELDEEFDLLEAKNVTKQGRTKLTRVRVRGGKVQRRRKSSAVKGYTIRGGKLVRMSSAERRHRKMAARRAKFKRRAKLRQALRKRKMSLRKRRAMGIR